MGVVSWTPVCTVIGVLNLLCFAVQCLLARDGLAAYAFPADHPLWYQYVTSMFLHASWWHLTANAFILFAFGSALEKKAGSLVFLVIYLSAGISGNLLFQLVYSGNGVGLGASGAIFGIITSMVIADPMAMVVMPGAPLPLPIFIFAPLHLLNEVLLFMNSTQAPAGGDKIAHMAHIGGGIAGALVGRLVIGRGGRGD